MCSRALGVGYERRRAGPDPEVTRLSAGFRADAGLKQLKALPGESRPFLTRAEYENPAPVRDVMRRAGYDSDPDRSRRD